MLFSRHIFSLLIALAVVLCTVPVAGAAEVGSAASLPDRGESLEQLLHRANQLASFDLATLYTPPAPEEYGTSFQLLGHGQVTLNLAENATIFDADERGLAVGFADGHLAAYGPLACPNLDPNPDAAEGQPLADAVQLLAYGQEARFLAATHAGVDKVSLFDLNACKLDRRLDVSGVTAMALSRSGQWLALAAADGQVLAGRPQARLQPVDVRLSSMLGVGFGPEGGVLYAVSRSGETVVWDMVNQRELARFQPRGGPFVSVVFYGQFMGLRSADGALTAWDMVAQKQVGYARQLAQFFIADNTLRYRTWNPILRVQTHDYAPQLEAWHAPSLGMIRVNDPDGGERCYDTGSGQARPCTTAPDFERVELTPFGGFYLGDTGYRLADVVWWWGHDVLVSRFVPEKGWFLWWVRAERIKQYNPLPEYLPQRASIRADRPAIWSPITPPPYYP